MNKITIRRFSPDDLSKILEIENSSFPKNIAFSRSDFMDYYSSCPEGFFVAENDGKTVGYAIATLSGKACIESVAVDEKHRKRGIGEELMKLVERICNQKGIKTIELETPIKNQSAIDFYKKQGYSTIGVKERFYPEDDAYIMQKTL